MLPKLQQSSLAQSLRRDNMATQVQCKNQFLFQVKTNSKISLEKVIMNPTNRGRINSHPKTHTAASETSLKNTSPKKKSKNPNTNPTMN